MWTTTKWTLKSKITTQLAYGMFKMTTAPAPGGLYILNFKQLRRLFTVQCKCNTSLWNARHCRVTPSGYPLSVTASCVTLRTIYCWHAQPSLTCGKHNLTPYTYISNRLLVKCASVLILWSPIQAVGHKTPIYRLPWDQGLYKCYACACVWGQSGCVLYAGANWHTEHGHDRKFLEHATFYTQKVSRTLHSRLLLYCRVGWMALFLKHSLFFMKQSLHVWLLQSLIHIKLDWIKLF